MNLEDVEISLEFGAILRYLCGAYPRHVLTKETTVAYWDRLSHVPIEQLAAMAEKHVDECKWWPSVSELKPGNDHVGRYVQRWRRIAADPIKEVERRATPNRPGLQRIGQVIESQE